MSDDFPKQNKIARRGRGWAAFVLMAAIVLAAIVVFVIGDLFGGGT